jgi:VCBS repeat protein
MNGTNVINGAILLNPGTAWHLIGTGDFNGDGKSDLLWQNSDGTPAIWLMNGTTIIGGAALLNPGPAWQAVGTADFNGDGKSDILFQNSSTGAAAIWEMNGTSFVGAAVLTPNLGTTWFAQA